MSAYEVLVIAMKLYDTDMCHPSNKKLEQYIPQAVHLLEMAMKEIVRMKP